MKILITSMNYADEFNVPIVSVFSKKDLKAIKKATKGKRNKEMNICFGTNEELSGTVGEFIDMLDSAEKISKKDLAVLIRVGVTSIDGVIDLVERLNLRFDI